jgi:hypothetical protein
MFTYIKALLIVCKARWELLRETKDAGYTTETVLWTGAFALLAIAVAAIIVAKVTGKANEISL